MTKIFFLLTIAVLGVVALTFASLIYARSQEPRLTTQTIQPASQAAQQQVALEKTITTQQRLNHYFHGDVIPKLKTCWSGIQGKGTVAFEFTYAKANGQWI